MRRGTTAKQTIKVIDEIFTNFGRPSRYRSDNGPPFSSQEFQQYMEQLGVRRDLSYAYRPQSNPVETWMKPLGKCLRIATRHHRDKEAAIRELLLAYRTTPHPATGLSPGEMLFRHGFRGAYPNRKTCTEEEFGVAVEKMRKDKVERCEKINQSVKRQNQPFEVGQWVLVSRKQRNKFDPLFHEEPWMIEALTKTGAKIHNPQCTKTKNVHFDDIKPYKQKQSGADNIAEATFTLPRQTQGEMAAADNQPTMVEAAEEDPATPPPRRSSRKKTSTRETKYKDFTV